MTQFSMIANAKIDDSWTNEELSLFAIVPDEAVDVDETAETVDSLVKTYLTGKSEEKTDALIELMELHARGSVLWPLGVQWDQSCLGKVTSLRLLTVLREFDPTLEDAREAFLAAPAFQTKIWKAVLKETKSFVCFRIFTTLRLATQGLESIESVSEALLLNLINALKENQAWRDFMNYKFRTQLSEFNKVLGGLHGRELLCHGVTLTSRKATGPRVRPVAETHPYLAWIDEAFERFADKSSRMSKQGPRDGQRLLIDYLKSVPIENTTPSRVFERDVMTSLLGFAKTWGTTWSRRSGVSKILDFSHWYARDIGTDPLKIGLTRYDLEQFSRELPPAPIYADVKAKPMPARFHHLLKEIVSEDNFAWAKSLRNGLTGLPSHWFSWSNPETNKVERIFCEVLPRMLLLHLDLPLRNSQVRRLDSGEGDPRMWNPATETWKDNTGPHAGHWERVGAKVTSRGVITEIITEQRTIAGFWINSNKTADGPNLFDETSGYQIPWQHDEVIQNIAAMLAWQEKYNPVDGPLPWAEIAPYIFSDDDPGDVVRAVLPDRFYLFRYPLNVGERQREAPPSYKIFFTFFHQALAELERRLNEEDPDLNVRIITHRDKSGNPRKAIFSIHGMRSSTLSTLHLAGVPIEILSKVVAGHASILMTLRYTKFDAAHVNEILTRARMQAMATAKEQFDNFLQSATLQQAMQMTARLSDDGIRQMKGAETEPTRWGRMELGICPNGGSLCSIGGERVRHRVEKADGRDKSAYGPTPGGHRNCTRCRFFITGLPFLLPMWAHATALMAKINSLSKRIAQTRTTVDALKRQRRDCGEQPAPRSLVDRIRVLDESWVADTEIRRQTLADAHHTMVLVEKIRAIARSGASDGQATLPMLFNEEGVPEVGSRETTRFELVDAVVQASRWFPSMDTADLERERDEFLNQILHRNRYVPITLVPLSQDEKRRAADALAALFLMELGADETQNLIEGKKTLAEVGLQHRLEQAAMAAVGRPIDGLTIGVSPRTEMIELQAGNVR